MLGKKDYQYYLDVINGEKKVSKSVFSDCPAEYGETAVLEYAFDKIEELNDIQAVQNLHSYLDGDINKYTSRKFLALRTLGVLSDERSESLIWKYRDSDNPDLSYIALCSSCELLERDKLSEKMTDIVVNHLVMLMIEMDVSMEELMEAAKTLKVIGYEKSDELVGKVEKRHSGFLNELKALF